MSRPASLGQVHQQPDSLLTSPSSVAKLPLVQHLASLAGKTLAAVHPESTSRSSVSNHGSTSKIAATTVLVLQTTAQFLCTTQALSSSVPSSNAAEEGPSSSSPVADAEELAQQVSRSGLLPQLAAAVGSAADQLPSDGPGLDPHSFSRAAALLQLALAVARMWPKSSLKSAAGALAAPTARLAVALLRASSAAANSSIEQQPLVAGAAAFALQMIQQLEHSRPPDQPFCPMPHLQQLQASSEFLLLVLLELDAQLQQLLPLPQQLPLLQQQEQQAAARLDSSAYHLWQQQHFWQQHSSASAIIATLSVLKHLLQYWQQQPAVPAADTSDLALLQYLPDKLLQLDRAFKATPEQVRVRFCRKDITRLSIIVRMLNVTARICCQKQCSQLEEVWQAPLRQWVLQLPRLLQDRHSNTTTSSSSSSSSSGAGGNSSSSNGKTLFQQLSQPGSRQAAAGAGSSSSSAPAASQPSTSRPASDSVHPLLDHRSKLDAMVATLWPRNGTRSSSSSSSSAEGLRLAKEVMAAAESCMRAVAAVELGNSGRDAATTALAERLNAGAAVANCLEVVLLPSSSHDSEACRALLQPTQLSLLCSAIKAFSVSQPVQSLGRAKEGSQAFETDSIAWIMASSGRDISNACIEAVEKVRQLNHMLRGHLASNSSSSSSSSSRGMALTAAISSLQLQARWMRVRALQLQHACHATREYLAAVQLVTGAAASQRGVKPGDVFDRVFAAGFEASGRDLRGAVEALVAAAGDAAKHVSIISECVILCFVPGSSSATAISGARSHAPATYKAVQQMRQRLQGLRDDASVISSTLLHALRLCAVLRRDGAPAAAAIPSSSSSSSSSSGDGEHVRCRAKLAAAASCEQLWAVLCSYGALQQLPQEALQLPEQLLAGLPVDWCCNNPGCSNSDGPSERALVADESCVCAGCRTARYCSSACQQAHQAQHRPVCGALAAAAPVPSPAAASLIAWVAAAVNAGQGTTGQVPGAPGGIAAGLAAAALAAATLAAAWWSDGAIVVAPLLVYMWYDIFLKPHLKSATGLAADPAATNAALAAAGYILIFLVICLH
uniref:MYND-type domain-containing protein n=1 Tax=Tetradesmus obliquus TaxID=3088 RepID=A0A383VBN1_TETOB|eukprot:jgi/Sobl393_1/15873/SZX62169.1